MSELTEKKCVPCEGGVPALEPDEVKKLLSEIPGWEVNADNTEISKTYSFKNYFRTMSFVNAVAYIANNENHHPDMEVSYNQCIVKYSTHAISGLSENDFICAAKVENLIPD